MLKSLHIKNIVLIEEAHIDFENNLCVLTGETGSGKSILLDALSLAIGVRSSSRLLRVGEKQGSVTAVFSLDKNQKCQELLAEIGLLTDDELILRRTINDEGKSRAFVNDMAVSQNFLNQLGDNLLEIHGQHDQRGLLNPAFHRDILDQYGHLETLRDDIASTFDEMQAATKKYEELQMQQSNTAAEIDYLEHILNEIRELNPKVGEEEELNSRRILLMNGEKILEVLNNVQDTLDGQISVSKLINNAQNYLTRSSQLGENLLEDGGNAFEKIVDDLEKSLIELNEGLTKIEQLERNLDFDEQTLNAVEERLFSIRSLARKLNISSDDMANYGEEIAKKLDGLRNQTLEMGDLEKKVEELRNSYLDKTLRLREERKLMARKLEEELLEELKPLKMENTRFSVEFKELDEHSWSRSGRDGVRFTVAVNLGTNLDDLSKVASGGELSRFMLALKVVLSKVKSVPTLIFDEIDTGISGVVADAVGERLRKLGTNLQVFVVTHLPQVASKGNNHYRISKQMDGNRTYTLIEKLDNSARREEIAKMISGENVTDQALGLAERLLGNWG